MDVWDWVERRVEELHEQGDHRLAELIYALPSAVVDEQHEVADAMIEEGLAVARERGDAWLEVFFRHWALQSRVMHRNDARKLGDAIEALEFAHRDECRGCPQAVCTVQDVASCYGLVDGPGYANERIAVCDEALGKISPSWNCFVCISNEKIDALLDRGRLDEASSFAEAQRSALMAAGNGDNEALLNLEEVLLRQGKYQEALEWSNRDADENDSEADRMSRRLRNGELMVHLGDSEEALAALPPLADMLERPGQLIRWLRLAVLLAERGILENHAALRVDLARAIGVLERNGILRIALDMSERMAYLAVVGKDRGGAERALDVMERTLPRLAEPLDAPSKVAAIRQLVSQTAWPEVDEESLTERLEHVQLKEDAAELLGELEAAHHAATARGRATWLGPLSEHLRRLGLADESARLLQRGFAEHPSEELAYHIGNLWLAHRRGEELSAFIAELGRREETWAQAASQWFTARVAIREGRYDEARRELLAMMPSVSPGHGARGLLAECERRCGNYQEALRWLDELLARGAEPGPWDWERMLVATLLERWDVVRDSATRVGMTAELVDGPDHGEGEFCQVVFPHGEYHWDAVRIGPVTAKIVEIAPMSQEAHFHEIVVFDRLMGQTIGETKTGEVDADGNPEMMPVYAYPVVATIRAPQWRKFAIDGVMPHEGMVAKLEEVITGFGGHVQDVSHRIMRGEYAITTPDGDDLPGLYLLAVVPAETSISALHRALDEVASQLEHPVVWLSLLDDIEDEAAAEAQRERASQYEITG